MLILKVLLLSALARGQGCVAVGSNGLMLGTHVQAEAPRSEEYSLSPAQVEKQEKAQAAASLLPRWEAAMGYRWFRSHRHFVGATEQTQRADEGSEVVNNNHLIDFSLTRAIGSRWRVQVGLPVYDASRWSPDRNAGGVVVGRTVTRSSGIGDLRVVASRWLLPTSSRSNVALGAGIKLPTGAYQNQDEVKGVDRSVDQSIQPGDGGTGLIMTLEAFRPGFFMESWFFEGSYLANPRGNNGVQTGRSLPGEQTMSVADQYVARGGAAFPLWRKYGLSGSLGARLEGVPVEDFLGPSDGFRRPGFTVSVEPGLTFLFGPLVTSLATPVALHRERQQSVADRAAGGGRHGDAAFADYSVIVTQSFRF